MELFDEDFMPTKKEGNKKTTTIIMVVIILLIIMVIGLVATIFYLKETSLSVKINGVSSQDVKNMLIIDEQNPSKVYVPIKQIASFLGYEAYAGNYIEKSQDDRMCYVQCDDEVAMFTLNSNIVYKTMPSESSDYEYFYLDEKVISRDGALYTTIDGIKKAFNVSFNYDVNNKKIEIYTLPYLVEYYSTYVTNQGYVGINENFINQKALLDSMIVVDKETTTGSSNTKVGVISANKGEAILEAKYDGIEYLQHTSDFLITDGEKMGIISKNKKTKVAIQYDNIELMDYIDYDKGLYCVKQNNKVGVIDLKGNIVINLDYEDIGIDNSKFKENDIKNGYIIANTLIPVQKDKLWGFFDTTGKQVTECKYDNLGYIATNNQAGYSLLVVPDYNVIVVEKDKKYTLITATGEEIWNFFPFDSVYLSIVEGTTSYKMSYNSEILDVCEYLDRLGYGKSGNSKTLETTNNNEDTSNEQENQNDAEGQNAETENNDNGNNEESNVDNNNNNGNNDNQNE